MAAKKNTELTFTDIVMGAKAEVIKQAYEARLKIDEQLAAREEAYRRIAEIEQSIEDIVGSPGEFVYPAPPLPVAGIGTPSENRRTFDKPSKSTRPNSTSKSSSSSAKDKTSTTQASVPTPKQDSAGEGQPEEGEDQATPAKADSDASK